MQEDCTRSTNDNYCCIYAKRDVALVSKYTLSPLALLWTCTVHAMAVFAHRDFFALFPDIFDADTEYMACSKACDARRPPAVGEQSGTSALFPGNFSSHTESENLSDNNDLCFLCLDSKLQRWERLAFDDSAHAQGLGSSVVAFERIAGGEGKSWKHDLRRLQSYSSTLMRDRMLRFACRHDLHTHLVSPRTVTGYVEAWLAYTNVSVLVHEVHARQQHMHTAAHGLLCEMAHDMYRQAMLAAATGQRKRAVWFYDTNTRKKRKF